MITRYTLSECTIQCMIYVEHALNIFPWHSLRERSHPENNNVLKTSLTYLLDMCVVSVQPDTAEPYIISSPYLWSLWPLLTGTYTLQLCKTKCRSQLLRKTHLKSKMPKARERDTLLSPGIIASLRFLVNDASRGTVLSFTDIQGVSEINTFFKTPA